MTTLDECQEVCFRDATALARTMDLIDVNALLLGEVSNSWSRQRFTSTSMTGLIITWGCCCNFIFDLVLDGHLLRDRFTLYGRQRGCRLSCVNLSFFRHLVNLNDHMTHGDDVVVAIVDSSDFARGCRGDLGDQLVREHLAKILVLCTVDKHAW